MICYLSITRLWNATIHCCLKTKLGFAVGVYIALFLRKGMPSERSKIMTPLQLKGISLLNELNTGDHCNLDKTVNIINTILKKDCSIFC